MRLTESADAPLDAQTLVRLPSGWSGLTTLSRAGGGAMPSAPVSALSDGAEGAELPRVGSVGPSGRASPIGGRALRRVAEGKGMSIGGGAITRPEGLGRRFLGLGSPGGDCDTDLDGVAGMLLASASSTCQSAAEGDIMLATISSICFTGEMGRQQSSRMTKAVAGAHATGSWRSALCMGGRSTVVRGSAVLLPHPICARSGTSGRCFERWDSDQFCNDPNFSHVWFV